MMRPRAVRFTFARFLAMVVVAIGLLSGAATASAQPSVVILVRHAERAKTPPDDPGLTPEGMQRARDLATVLAGTHVGVIVTTQLKRTQLTAAPIAEKTGAKSIIVPTGTREVHADSVAAAVRRVAAGEAVLVVGHSNTIPAIIAALGGPQLPDLCDAQYSNLFVLVFSGTAPPRFIQSGYGVADAPDAASCRDPKKP